VNNPRFFPGDTMLRLCPALTVACIATAAGQEIRYAMELNHVPVECRSVAMGNSGVALIRNGTSAFWNPALPAFNTKYEIAVEGAKLYANLADLGTASMSAQVQDGMSMGTVYTGFFSGDILLQDTLPGTPLERLYNPELRASGSDSKGVFHNNQHRIQVFVARIFPIPIPRPAGVSIPLPVDVAAGLNFKYYWQTMTPEDNVRMGFNVNMDFGAAISIGADFDLTRREISRRILFGMAIRDFLPTQVMWVQSPIDYREHVNSSRFYGVSYNDNTGFFKGNWTLSAGVHKTYSSSIHVGLEGEFWDIIAFRAGLSDRMPTVGAGIHTDIFSIDYAMSFDEIAISPLRLAIGFSF